MHPSCLPADQLLKEVRIDFTRTRGPGGQHRNKVETGVRVVHVPTGITATGFERRSRELNLRNALFRLRIKLALDHRQTTSGGAESSALRPSELWSRRIAKGRMVVSTGHEDFPALLAEALDLLLLVDDDVPGAARLLRVSTAQLIRFLSLEPESLAELNARLKRHGRKGYSSRS